MAKFMLDGKPYNGPMHRMPDGSMHTGKTHTAASRVLKEMKETKETKMSKNGLTAAQKKLPMGLQKAILASKKK